MSEAAANVNFSTLRYGQCWEDADVLIDGLEAGPGDVCVSVASGGDNTLALLAQGVESVVAIDLNPAQIACLELKVAAFATLEHAEVLELVGSVASDRRAALYQRCRAHLSASARDYWDQHAARIHGGINHAGKFERYVAFLRRWCLPLIHGRGTIARLFEDRSLPERNRFYDEIWGNWRWRTMVRLATSRAVLARAGRDPGFYRYVEDDDSVLLERVKHGFINPPPSENPYLVWAMTGNHGTVLPYAFRPEHFDAIRNNLSRLRWECTSLESYLQQADERSVGRFNLSNIFEYVSWATYREVLEQLVRVSVSGARLAYWNLLVPRRAPQDMSARIRSLDGRAQELIKRNGTFMHAAFVLEEVP